MTARTSKKERHAIISTDDQALRRRIDEILEQQDDGGVGRQLQPRKCGIGVFADQGPGRAGSDNKAAPEKV